MSGDGAECTRLAGAGSAWRQNQNQSLAWLSLKIILNSQAEIGLGPEKSETHKLSSAQARGEVKIY